jgi:hypothetical protein
MIYDNFSRIFAKKNWLLLLLAGLILPLASCATPKSLIGINIGNTSRYTYYCEIVSLPKQCSMGNDTNPFIFTFTITEGQSNGEYIIDGFIDATKGKLKSWSHLTMKDCRFNLHLVHNNVIINSISLVPTGRSLSRKLPFAQTFNSKYFDAVLIDGKYGVRG